MPTSIDWPGAAQVLQIRRTRTVNGRKRTEVVYATSSVPMDQAQPRTVAAWIRGTPGIENAPHTVISLLRLAGWTSTTAGLRHHAHDSSRPIELLSTS